MKKIISYIFIAVMMTSCFSGRRVGSVGGEVTGVGAVHYSEPTPYGMVLIDCGSMKEGPGSRDSTWGTLYPTRQDIYACRIYPVMAGTAANMEDRGETVSKEAEAKKSLMKALSGGLFFW